MKTNNAFSNLAVRFTTAVPTRLLPLLLVLMLPAAVQAQFTYTTSGASIIITGYNGPCGAVTIPSLINGLPVTSIGDQAFYSYTGLTAITIPDSVTKIGQQAFSECIGLTNITIGKSVTSIGDSAFYCCYSLAGITVDPQNGAYSSADGVLFDKGTNTLIQYPTGKAGSYVVPERVSNIGGSAFSHCGGLTNVTIGNGVTSIGYSAFQLCINLIRVAIPDSVTNAEPYTFCDCWGLANVTIGNGVPSIRGYEFQNCHSLTNVTIGNSVTDIRIYAFQNCGALTSVRIPDSVTNIGNYAFNACGSLMSASIGNGVISIGDYAFYQCSSLASVTFGTNVAIIGYATFDSCNALTSLLIPKSVKQIDQWAFAENSGLRFICFLGNYITVWPDVLQSSYPTVYRMPGTTGWGTTFCGRPVEVWNVQIQTRVASFGVWMNKFGFPITGNNGLAIVVEACTNLANPVWSPVGIQTLSGGSSYFSDPQWTKYPARFYRLRWP